MICAMAVNGFSLPVSAANVEPDFGTFSLDVARATNRFSMTVSANKLKRADSSFSLSAGEVVTINASYTPASASVDFGLIDSDGVFHYINVKSGSINQGITVDKNGQYTLAVCNNSSSEIAVSGFVDYLK